MNKQKYNNAYKNYNESSVLYLKEHDSLRAGYNFIKTAWINTLFNDYNSAQADATKALELVKNNKSDKDFLPNIYLSLGNSFLGLQQDSLAIENYSKADALTEDEAVKIGTQNNIANIYITNDNYKKAILILSNTKRSELLNNDPEKKAAILDNLGFAKLKNGDKSGMVEMQEAMSINKNYEYIIQLAKSYLHFSEYYMVPNKLLAIDYAKKAYNTATISQATDDRIAALNKLFVLTSGETSKVYGVKLNKLKDSISDIRRKENNTFAYAKYSLSEKDNELLKFRVAQLKDEKKDLIVYISIFILICCGITLYFLYRSKYRREKLKEIYNTETRISKKLHDELANDVYNVMTYTSTKELSEENKENILNKLDDIYSRTRNISKENASIDTGPAFGFQLKEMIAAYSNKDVNVIINGLEAIDWNTIESNKKIAVSRVIQELLVNMKKHSQCSFAALTFKKIKNNLHIDYSDNGVGLATDAIILKNGLLNVETRIHAINGTVTFDTTSDKGFRLAIVFPI